MQILMATHDDVDEIVALGSEVHAESESMRQLPYVPEITGKAIHDALGDKRNRYCVLIARSGTGAMVGLLLGNIERPLFSSALMAQNIVFLVKREYRGSSAAVRLLKAFANWARKRQVAGVCIYQNSAIDVERFSRFMRRLGFRLAGTNYVAYLG